MSIIDYIEKAQGSSVSKRKAMLVISTAIIMSIIVTIWFFQFRLPLSDEIASHDSPNADDPFTLLGASFKALFNGAQNSGGELYIPKP